MGGLHCLLVTPTCTPREQPLSPPGLAGHYAALQDLWLDIQASVGLKEETQGAPVTPPHTHIRPANPSVPLVFLIHFVLHVVFTLSQVTSYLLNCDYCHLPRQPLGFGDP